MNFEKIRQHQRLPTQETREALQKEHEKIRNEINGMGTVSQEEYFRVTSSRWTRERKAPDEKRPAVQLPNDVIKRLKSLAEREIDSSESEYFGYITLENIGEEDLIRQKLDERIARHIPFSDSVDPTYAALEYGTQEQAELALVDFTKTSGGHKYLESAKYLSERLEIIEKSFLNFVDTHYSTVPNARSALCSVGGERSKIEQINLAHELKERLFSSNRCFERWPQSRCCS
ncbi:MAG: hypothetical protein Q8Q18_03860 [bacterium]|nr:hypothetical protein [bacterium]